MFGLNKTMPSTVMVGGISVPINTDWRTWISVWKVVDSVGKSDFMKSAAILLLAYSHKGESPTPYKLVQAHPDEALKQAMDFLSRHNANDPVRPQTPKQKRLADKRLIDWDWDASTIIADFEREYSIDLTDPNLHMHWWRFMSLFTGLSDTSKTMDTVNIRAADLDSKHLSAKEKRLLKERKRAVMLPARTSKEAAENRQLRGSDV